MGGKQIQCPNCGGPNNIIEGEEIIKCIFCSSSFVVQEVEDQTTKIKPVNEEVYNWMVLAETAREGGNHEEAISYYNKILEKDSSHSASWFGKGASIILISNLGDIKMSEALTYYKKAIEFSKDSNEMKKAVANELQSVVLDFFWAIQRHYLEFEELDDSALEYWRRFEIIEAGLAFALECAPENLLILSDGLNITDFIQDDLRTFGLDVTPIKEKYITAKKKIDPDWEPPKPSAAKGSGCFIATATMGDYNNPTVIQLRHFRDNYLAKKDWGRSFIDSYCKYSPYIAILISKSTFLKSVSYILLIKPLKHITKWLLKKENLRE